MKENQNKAFDFASDTTKQLITLSTGIIALTVTFSKDIIGFGDNSPKTLLVWTWGIFIVSICFGILTLMALTGTLQPMSKSKKDKTNKEQKPDTADTEDISINNGNIRLLSILQILFFVAALIMTGIFGSKSLSVNNPQNNHRNCYQIIRETKLGTDTTTKYIDTLFVPRK